MARLPMVRNTSETNSEYTLDGVMLTEKMKRVLRRKGIKNNADGSERTWAEVFSGSDVVYSFNPRKGKQDVFVGFVYRVKYPSGKTKTLTSPAISPYLTIDNLMEIIPESKRAHFGTFRVSTNHITRVRN